MEELAIYLPENREESTLSELQSTAHKLGLKTAAIQWRGDAPPFSLGVSPAVLPVVLPSGRGHFVALLESRGGKLLIGDYPGPPHWISSSVLREIGRWDGTALHIAGDATALLRLRLAAFSWLRIGLILAGAAVAVVVLAQSRRRTCEARRRSDGVQPRAGFSAIELIVVMALIGILLSLILPAVQKAREASRRTQCQNNLRQIGVALNGFEAARGQYPTLTAPRPHPKPPLTVSALSINSQLLPYLDQQPLFDRIDPDEDGYPGDIGEPPTSATNAAVLGISVPVFMCPSDLWLAGSASYRACSGTSPGMHTTPNVPLPNSSRGGFATGALRRTTQEIRDGLSHTVFFSEKLLGDQNPSSYSPARDTILNVPAVAYNNFLLPDDAASGCRLPYSAVVDHASYGGASWLFSGAGHTRYNHVLAPNSRTPDCTSSYADSGPGATTARSLHVGGVHALIGDGAVRFVNQEIEIDVWRALGTINSGDSSVDY